MHRSSVSIRPPQSLFQPLRRPLAKVISIKPYLHRVRALIPTPVPEPEPAQFEPEADDRVRDRLPSMSELREQLRGMYSSLEMRVLNQYIRCVQDGSGLAEHVYAIGLDRLRHATTTRRSVTLKDIWYTIARELSEDLRRFVASAVVTGEATLRGYEIRRGLTLRRRSVFITWHPHELRVVGIYNGTQWNHKRAYRFARQKSHRLSQR